MWQFWGLKVLRRRIFALFAILLLLASVPNIYKYIYIIYKSHRHVYIYKHVYIYINIYKHIYINIHIYIYVRKYK